MTEEEYKQLEQRFDALKKAMEAMMVSFDLMMSIWSFTNEIQKTTQWTLGYLEAIEDAKMTNNDQQ